MIRSVRLYSNKANPGFLTDLLARIDAIPERIAQRDQQKAATKAAPALNTSSPQTSTRGGNARVSVADHPLALFNDSKGFGNRRNSRNNNNRPNNNYNNNNSNNNNNNPARQNGSKPFGGPRRMSPRNPKRIVSSDKRVREQTVESCKKITAEPSQPKLDAAALFYGRSSKLNHSTTSRVASVSKEILLESKYPYHFPQHVIENAPVHGNKFVLKNNFSTKTINNETLKLKLNSKVLGQIEEINLKEKEIPKGLKDHAIFAKKGLQLNADFSASEKQRVYDVVSGIKPVSSLVEGCHWIKK